MDSITQGLLGAAAAQAVLGPRLGARAWVYGALGGMAADLDVFIRSDDPLVGWRYHRHFTHSLAFIPFGGVITALPFVLLERWRKTPVEPRMLVLATTVGYATHALLDAFTTYGTMLWWPFSQARVAWSWVAIIDPIYSAILLAGIIVAARRRWARPARIALLLSSLYLAIGGVQHWRALGAMRTLADQRGHTIDRDDAVPTSASNLVWRTMYEAEGKIWVDEARVPWWSAAVGKPGASIEKLTVDDLPASHRDDPRVMEGFETFRWFANDWIAWDPAAPQVVGDQRYGVDVAGTASMWGVRLDPDAPVKVEAYQAPRMSDALGRRWRNLLGDDAR